MFIPKLSPKSAGADPGLGTRRTWAWITVGELPLLGDTDSPSGICFSIIFLLVLFFFFLHNNRNSYTLSSTYCVPGPALSSFYTGSCMVGEKEPRAGIQALLLAEFIHSLITSVTKCF